MYKNLDPRNTAYKLANRTGPRIDRSPYYQTAQAILAGERMDNQKLFQNSMKRVNHKKKLLTKNEGFRKKHLQMVKTITNKKLGELIRAEKTASDKLDREKKAIEDNINKKTKAFTNATKVVSNVKSTLNKAMSEKNNKINKALRAYRNTKTKINKDRQMYNKMYQRVYVPSNNHLLYGRSKKADIKRNIMAKFLVQKMYYEPQKNLQAQSKKYIANHQIHVPPYQPDMLANMYKIGTRGKYNTLQTGKFTLPVNIYDKSGKLKPYQLIAKELKNLRPKSAGMNVNNGKKNGKKQIAASADAKRTGIQEIESNIMNGVFTS